MAQSRNISCKSVPNLQLKCYVLMHGLAKGNWRTLQSTSQRTPMKTTKKQGLAAPYTVTEHIESASSAQPEHTRSTPGAHPEHTSSAQPDDREGKHTAKELAEHFEIAGSTLRTRWYRWLCEAVDESRLKVDGKFTDLAKHLFGRYKAEVADVEGASGADWAALIAPQYPQVIEAELEPEPQAGGMQLYSSALALQADAGLERQSDEIDRIDEAIALAKQALQGNIALLQEKAAAQDALTEQRQKSLDELRVLQIQQDELLRIERERQEREREAEIRRSVREQVLGKSFGQP